MHSRRLRFHLFFREGEHRNSQVNGTCKWTLILGCVCVILPNRWWHPACKTNARGFSMVSIRVLPTKVRFQNFLIPTKVVFASVPTKVRYLRLPQKARCSADSIFIEEWWFWIYVSHIKPVSVKLQLFCNYTFRFRANRQLLVILFVRRKHSSMTCSRNMRASGLGAAWLLWFPFMMRGR